jgi:dephospho-CoA kinase
MAKLILGITGEMGSGKGSIAKHVMLEHKGGVHRFSTMLRDMLKRIYIEETRENISTLSSIIRKNFGEDVLAKALYHDLQNDEHDIVVLDGARRMSDIEYLNELPIFKLIYVEADIRTRYERVVKRNENSEDAEKTFDEFKKDQEREPETQIRDLKYYAAHVIDNNGTYQDLYKQVDDIIAEFMK